MDESFYFTLQVDSNTKLTISPIADWEIDASGQHLDDESGYFLIETRQTCGLEEVRIIARLMSPDAALELRQMLNMR